MKAKLITIATVLLFATVAHASPRYRFYAAADGGSVPETGLSADALSGGATSDTINMGEKFYGSTLDWHVTITAGTTADVQVTCEESMDGSTWVNIMGCTSATTSNCLIQKLNYSMAEATAFSVLIEKVRTQYMRCTFEDLAAGNGTISASATVGSP